MERLKNFNFDDWRRRYMNWHKDNRARITDFFRRQDRDHDGKISREEFIQGILSSSNISKTHFLSPILYISTIYL
jgi:dystonin